METIHTKETMTINDPKSVITNFKERCGEITGIETTDFDTVIEILRDGVISIANPDTPISAIRPLISVLNEVMFLMKDLTAALSI